MSEDFDEGVDQDVHEDEEPRPARRTDREPPPVRPSGGTGGVRPECLDHLGVVWTDMRPAGPHSRLGRTILR
jgi:MbtH protein